MAKAFFVFAASANARQLNPLPMNCKLVAEGAARRSRQMSGFTEAADGGQQRLGFISGPQTSTMSYSKRKQKGCRRCRHIALVFWHLGFVWPRDAGIRGKQLRGRPQRRMKFDPAAVSA